jgi:hypothetical protein
VTEFALEDEPLTPEDRKEGDEHVGMTLIRFVKPDVTLFFREIVAVDGSRTPPRRLGRTRVGHIKSSRGDRHDGLLAQVRRIIREADREALEERKWKMPSKPAAVPVWSHDRISCVCDFLKAIVRLTFPKGASLRDRGTGLTLDSIFVLFGRSMSTRGNLSTKAASKNGSEARWR